MAVTIDGTNGITTPPTLTLQAGATTAAPLNFTAGTNLTTAIAGAMEYDGKVIYATPQGTQRGVVPGAQFFRLNSDLAGANATGAQNTFGVGVTLSASTVYAFEALVVLTKTAGTTLHNIQSGFGGTATLNGIQYTIHVVAGTTQPAYDTAMSGLSTNSATATNASTGINTANNARAWCYKGTVSVNAGGTFIPQYTLSAAPGGAYTTNAGSYFLIYPIGAAGANTSVGAWA